MAVSVEQLEEINRLYPNNKAYKTMAGPNLTLPQFCSGNRLQMFSQHLEHGVTCINSEIPRMPTSFEKSFGIYTDSYKVADADYMVVGIIPKYTSTFRFKYVYIVQNMITKVYDIIDVSHYECLSEDHGYLRPYTESDTYVIGSVIKKGTTIYKSTNHDEYGNYKYGLNLKVGFISLSPNEEDGVVISRSAYNRGEFYMFKNTPFTLNKNQILCNTYGDNLQYKCFPDIGEEVKEGILFARRTINYSNAPAELSDNALKTLLTSDEIFNGEGVVADIDVWINDTTEFEDAANKTQIYKYYTLLLEYYTKMYNILDPIINSKKKNCIQYTHRLRYEYEHARNYLDTNIQWLNNNNSFEFAYINIVTYEKKNIFEGYKLTNRFGGKCIITGVWEDEYMPRDEYGNVCDIIVSPPGIPARANPGQQYEQEYCFIANEINKRIAKLKTIFAKEKLLLEFIKDVSQKEFIHLKKFLSEKNPVEKELFFKDMEEHGIFLIEEPFSGTISKENLELLYNKYNVKPSRITMSKIFKSNITALPLSNKNTNPVINDKTGMSYLHNNNTILQNGVSPFDITDKKQKYITQDNGFYPIQDNNGNIDYRQILLSDFEKLNQFEKDDISDNNDFEVVDAYINKDGNLVRTYRSMNRVVIGDVYYFILKQTPDEKFSVRSLGSMNQTGIPNKPGKQGNLTSPYSKSAIRNGEMENDNFFTRIDKEIVHRYMSTHSTNPEMREKMAKMLLTKDPLELWDLEIDSEDIKDDIPALMFHSINFSIGIEILPIYEGEEDMDEMNYYY